MICTRGGYGAQRIVDAIDMAAVRRDPKVVAGFSDITALQLALWRGARLAGVHGPGAAWRDERTPLRSAESLHAALMTTEPVTVAAAPQEETYAVRVPGRATGTLLGGNLCLIDRVGGHPGHAGPDRGDPADRGRAGAPVQGRPDAHPPAPRGALDGLAGVAVGQFTGCADGWDTTVVDVLDRSPRRPRRTGARRPADRPRPRPAHRPGGHPATLDADEGTLTVTSAVR